VVLWNPETPVPVRRELISRALRRRADSSSVSPAGHRADDGANTHFWPYRRPREADQDERRRLFVAKEVVNLVDQICLEGPCERPVPAS
jgi:hypothetical protein